MQPLTRNPTRTFFAGIVALLPTSGVVFVRAAPTRTTERVVLLREARTERIAMSVHEALRCLVAAGKLEEGNRARLAVV